MFGSFWSTLLSNLPLVGLLVLAVLAVMFLPQATLIARWALGTPQGRMTLVAVVICGLWFRDHHRQYATGFEAGVAKVTADNANARAAAANAALTRYVGLTERFAHLSENLNAQVDEAADAAAGRVVADLAAGRLQIRPVWRFPAAGAGLQAPADSAGDSGSALGREAAVGRVLGIGAAADLRYAKCVAILKAERQAPQALKP